jgi:serine/threonine protein kinase
MNQKDDPMSAPGNCPRIEDWQELFGSAAASERWEACERHLESCPSCQARLDRGAQDEEPLVRLGRQMGDPTRTPPDPALGLCLQRLHDCRETDETATTPELYFLCPADRPDLLGTLGEYEVSEVVGQGGMGVVLKAFDTALRRVVAIKVMAAALAGSATARRRFTREAQAAAAVCHDHVVTVHAVREAEGGLPYLVMQYVAGESLQARLDRVGPLEVEAVVQIGLQTALGLAAAHAQGLIHRDVKPANLLLENGLSRVKISDFGLARMANDVRLTHSGMLMGTPEYAAPEQASGAEVDHRCDLFSLGCVLYAACVGHSPFRAATPLEALRRVTDQQPRPLRSLNPAVPAWLEALIRRLLEKEPAARFQSAAEVASLLEGYLAHLRQPWGGDGGRAPRRAV